MLDKISPYQPNPREEANRSDRTRPSTQPKDENFRKSMRDRQSPKEQDVDGKDEHEDASSSVFDLSRTKTKAKTPQTPSKSSLKDSSASDLGLNRPIVAKEGKEQGQDQGLFSQEGEATETAGEEFGSEMTQNEPPASPVPAEPKKMEQPPSTPTPKTPTKLPQQEQLDIPQQVAAQNEGALRAAAGKKSAKEESSFETSQSGSASKKQKSSSKDDSSSTAGSAGDKGDLAAAAGVNNSIQAVGFQSERSEDVQAPIRSSDIRDIAAQIVDRIQILKKGDETQTTITLRQPPVLAGATITLTASDHAKREFNITFANLTPEAKMLVDRKLREDPLTDRLKDEGITVHMLSTTTKPVENILNTEGADQTSRDRQDQRQQQQDQRDQQKKRQVPQNPDEEV